MADDSDSKPDAYGWSTIDVQRTIGSAIIAVFGVLLMAMTVRIIISGLPADALELLKQGFNALINIVMVVVGFWFGSSKGSQTKDDSQTKIMEKLTATEPAGKPGPVAPVTSAATPEEPK